MTYPPFNMSFAQESYAAQAERYQRMQEQRGSQEWLNEREQERQAYWEELQRHNARQVSHNHWTLILRLPRSATVAEIRKRYRELAKVYHADAGGSDERMAKLNAARDLALADKKGM